MAGYEKGRIPGPGPDMAAYPMQPYNTHPTGMSDNASYEATKVYTKRPCNGL